MKRANRSGSVDEVRPGRWRARVTVDGRRRTLGVWHDEAIAWRMLRAWLDQVDEGEIVAPDSVTLRSFGADWLDRRELFGSRARDRVKTIEDERSLWRRHVEPSELADLAVQSIGPRDVEAFAMWLRRREAVSAVRRGQSGTVLRPTGRPISAAVQRHVLRVLRQCLDDAVAQELLVANPAARVRVRPAPADLEDDWLRADEIETLLSCEALPLRDRMVYAAAIGLALRLNDLKLVEVDDVRLDDQVPGPHVRVRIAKSDRVHRIPVLPWLEPLLRAHLEALPEGSRWVFPRADGDRYRKDWDFGWAAKVETGRPRRPSALERAGVDRRIRFHDLRGTTATHLALGTWGRAWSLHEIQRMLAHADQRTTERYVRRALDELANAARETRGGPAVGHGWSRRDREVLADATGFEPVTFGSGGPGQQERSRDVAGRVTNGVTNAAELAEQLLLEAQGAAVPPELLETFLDAAAAHGAELVRLAVEARQGGETRLRRALELAAVVLGRQAADRELRATTRA